jgi:tripartite-type tricarboxylate transporter receptor subunit TctC
MELLKQRAGIDVVNIPFKGTAAVMQELMSGRVALAFADLSAARGQIQSSKVRPIAVASKKRLGALPNVPTFEEAGFPDFEVFFWQGIAVPTGTPPEIVSKLSTELFKTMNTPEVQKRLTEVGMEVLPTSSDGMGEIIRKDQTFWVPLIKKLGIRVD